MHVADFGVVLINLAAGNDGNLKNTPRYIPALGPRHASLRHKEDGQGICDW